jgi:hypothetical protein
VRPGSLINQQSRRFQTRCHFREFEFNSLKFSNSPTELAPLLAIRNGFFQSALRKSNRSRAHRAAQQIQCLKRKL